MVRPRNGTPMSNEKKTVSKRALSWYNGKRFQSERYSKINSGPQLHSFPTCRLCLLTKSSLQRTAAAPPSPVGADMAIVIGPQRARLERISSGDAGFWRDRETDQYTLIHLTRLLS